MGNNLPPWLDTMMPSTPTSTALIASSGCWIPFNTIGPFQCFFNNSRSSHLWPLPEAISCIHAIDAFAISSSICFPVCSLNLCRNTGSEKPICVPIPFAKGKYPPSRSHGRHYIWTNECQHTIKILVLPEKTGNCSIARKPSRDPYELDKMLLTLARKNVPRVSKCLKWPQALCSQHSEPDWVTWFTIRNSTQISRTQTRIVR